MTPRTLTGLTRPIALWLSIFMSMYHILYLGGLLEFFNIYIDLPSHRAAHIGFSLAIGFMLYARSEKSKELKIPWYDLSCLILAVGWNVYIFFFFTDITLYVSQARLPLFYLIPAAINIVLVLEIARRTIGIAMPLIAATFVLYAIFSQYLPGFLKGNLLDFEEVVRYLGLWVSGIYGGITQISASVVIMYLILAAFLYRLGAGDFFITLANALMGKVRGGPAKIAIFASGFLGSLVGSTAANVTTTGVITIPMMKRLGYKPHFAGAVEAVASNGGQITPPVLGLVGFIMADFLGISYWSVAIAATLPALLYYTALFFMVDFEAARTDLKGLSKEELPSITETIEKGWHYLIPFFLLIYFLVALEYSPQKAALYALLGLIAVSYLRNEEKPGMKVILDCLADSAKIAVTVAATCAVAGVITGALEASGLVGKLAAGVVWLAGESLIMLLVLTAVTAFLMGMGVTSAGVYILVALLIAPALIKMGITPLAAHMYVYYFAMAALITPPVCVAAYIAAGIAGSEPFRTGWSATRLGIVTYIAPILFIYKPAILMIGTWPSIVEAAISGFFAMIALASGIQGYLFIRLLWFERLLMLLSTICLLFPGMLSSIIGYTSFACVLFLQLLFRRDISKKNAIDV